MMRTELQANICSCGGIWFNQCLPESEPNRCPFCNKELVEDESSHTSKLIHDDEHAPDVTSNEGFNIDINNLRMVSKVCRFCKNQLFFDTKTADKAFFCPYCDDYLFPENSPEITGKTAGTEELDMLNGANINELMNRKVAISFNSILPWKKPVEYIFGGVDLITMRVKLLNAKGELIWVAFDTIKGIKELSDDNTYNPK